jgi:serine protease Do
MGLVVGLGISVSMDWVNRLRAEPQMPEAEMEKELENLRRQSQALAALAAKVKPSVVTIVTSKTVRLSEEEGFDPFREFFEFFGPPNGGTPRRPQPQIPREFHQYGQGSGVVVSYDAKTKKAIILTNAHVAGGQDELQVRTADGRQFEAKLRGADPKTDVATIEITGPDLPPAKLGNSEVVQAGEMVLAIGSPFGLEQTVTVGHISAKGRSGIQRGTGKYENYIQTDTAINPGNSGGPLINLRGEVIGINTMIFTRTGTFSGVGMAVPINMAKVIMGELLDKGKVTRAWLGIGMDALPPEVKQQLKIDHGIQVSRVMEGDPAAKAGIKEGDIILEFNGQKVDDLEKFRLVVAETKVGSTVPVKLLRGKETLNVKVTLTEQPEDVAVVRRPQGALGRRLGLSVQELTAELAEQLGYQGQKGVLVTEVDPRGPAGTAKPTPLKEGDLIQEAAREPVASLADFQRLMAAADLTKGVLLFVRSRDGTTRYAVLKTER